MPPNPRYVMKYKFLGKTHEKLSEIGVGTWELGNDYEENKKAMEFAINNGVNIIDTAEIYGTESFVGDVIKGRTNLFITTKVWATHFKRHGIMKACERSLKTLQIKQIDLYQLHWPNPIVDIKETMRAMEELIYNGKIRYIGVSNFNKKQLIDAQNALSRCDIVSNQVEYNIVNRRAEIELMDYMKKERITLMAYSPFAHGAIFKRKYGKLLKSIKVLSKKYEATPSQIILNWLMNKDIVIPLTKASKLAHMVENINTTRFNINPEDNDYINKLTSVTSSSGVSMFKIMIEFYVALFSMFKR